MLYSNLQSKDITYNEKVTVCTRKKKYMVKNTECLKITNCCAFKGSNVSNDATTVF